MYTPQEQLNGKVTFHWRISRLFRTAFMSIPLCAILFVALVTFFNLWIAIIVPIIYILFRFFYALIWPSFEIVVRNQDGDFQCPKKLLLVKNGLLRERRY